MHQHHAGYPRRKERAQDEMGLGAEQTRPPPTHWSQGQAEVRGRGCWSRGSTFEQVTVRVGATWTGGAAGLAVPAP